jgi:hypothetical protein
MMAQHARDNELLGCRVVSMAELRHSFRPLDERVAPVVRAREEARRRRQCRRARRPAGSGENCFPTAGQPSAPFH